VSATAAPPRKPGGRVGALAGAERASGAAKRYPMTVTDFKTKGRTKATLVQVGRLGHAWTGRPRRALQHGQGPDASRNGLGLRFEAFGDRA
jgi:hypothetical protein